MMEKLKVTATLEASGVTRDGVKFTAVKKGPVEDVENMKRQIEDMFSRSDSKQVDAEEAEQK